MDSGKLYIGWNKVDVTPEEKVLIIGQFYPRISDEVVSPVTATVLALETRDSNDKTIDQAIFLSCDFPVVDEEIFVSPELPKIKFKDKLVYRLKTKNPGFDLIKLTINSTHTHNAPVSVPGFFPDLDHDEFMNPLVYQEFLLEQFSNAIIKAWNSRTSGGISRGFDYAKVACCRRALYKTGKAIMYGETTQDDFTGLESVEDHSVNMLFTWNEEKELTGIICNLACPAQTDELGNFISADFWHEVRIEIADRFNQDVQLLPLCGAAGDMSPHPMINIREEADLRKRRSISHKQAIAKRIIFAIENAFEPAEKDIESKIVMRHEVKHFLLPHRIVTDEELYKYQTSGIEIPTGLISNLTNRYEYQKKVKESRFESHIIRIGDCVIATNPFELFTGYGIRIKARSKALQTFLVQLSDAYGFYLPTEYADANRGFGAEVNLNWVGPEGGCLLVEKTVQTIAELFPEPKKYKDATVKPNFTGSRRETSPPYQEWDQNEN